MTTPTVVQDVQTSLSRFFDTTTCPLLCLSGPTGSGKTTGVLRYLQTHQQGKRVAFLLPRRACIMKMSNAATPSLLKMQSYATFALLALRSPEKACARHDVIVLDEFHHHSVDKAIVMAFLRRFINQPHEKKLIVMSATMAPFHHDYLADTLGVPTAHWQALHLPPPPSAWTTTIHYMDHIVEPSRMVWQSPPTPYALFGKQEHAHWIVSAVAHLAKRERGTRERVRMLVFLHSGHWCDRVAHDLGDVLNGGGASLWSIVTCHGQMDKTELDSVLHAEDIPGHQIIVATNLVESSVTLRHVNVVVDFGVAFFPDARDMVVLKWCTQSEWIQRAGRTGRTCDGIVYRMVTKALFDMLPYATEPTHDWSRPLLQEMTMKGTNAQASSALSTLLQQACASPLRWQREPSPSPTLLQYERDVEQARHHLQTLCLDDRRRWPACPLLQKQILQTSLHTTTLNVLLTVWSWRKDAARWAFATMVLALLDVAARGGLQSLFYVRANTNKGTIGFLTRKWHVMCAIMFPPYQALSTCHTAWDVIAVYLNMVCHLEMASASKESTHALRYDLFGWNGRLHRQFRQRWSSLLMLGAKRDVCDDGKGIRDAIAAMRDKGWIQTRPMMRMHSVRSCMAYARAVLTDEAMTRWVSTWEAFVQKDTRVTVANDAWETWIDHVWRTHPVHAAETLHPTTTPHDSSIVLIDLPSVRFSVPPPMGVRVFLGARSKKIANAVDARAERCHQREHWRAQFDACVEQIREDVAFRPGMVGYLHHEAHFYAVASGRCE